jgi:hypothetical protein
MAPALFVALIGTGLFPRPVDGLKRDSAFDALTCALCFFSQPLLACASDAQCVLALVRTGDRLARSRFGLARQKHALADGALLTQRPGGQVGQASPQVVAIPLTPAG